MKQADVYYQAMLARDHRFDGKFFIGVTTTGIYCRPICPAKPNRENVEFFPNRMDAENAGYRPCLRCRPESAPHSALWFGKSELVQRALKALHSDNSIGLNEEEFAAQFDVSARHLRRIFSEEIGKTPKQIAAQNRLNLARQLITETQLRITEIAFASGFDSIRRFNSAFKERFKRPPREIRRNKSSPIKGIEIALSYRPPFDYDGLIAIYKSHRIGNLEWFEGGKMIRIISYGDDVGTVTISNDPEKCRLLVEIDFPDTRKIHTIVSKVRSLFDLDSDPAMIAEALKNENQIKQILDKYPGIRLPSGWDPFEISISAILGQLVSVQQSKNLVNHLIEIAGEDLNYSYQGVAIRSFPTPLAVINADLSSLRTTGRRKETLKLFSQAVLDGDISLEATQDVSLFTKKILRIKGIGPWTANYILLKAIRNTDTFPKSDLLIGRALKLHNADKIEKMSPWRGYVASLFWRHYSSLLTKKKKT